MGRVRQGLPERSNAATVRGTPEGNRTENRYDYSTHGGSLSLGSSQTETPRSRLQEIAKMLAELGDPALAKALAYNEANSQKPGSRLNSAQGADRVRAALMGPQAPLDAGARQRSMGNTEKGGGIAAPKKNLLGGNNGPRSAYSERLAQVPLNRLDRKERVKDFNLQEALDRRKQERIMGMLGGMLGKNQVTTTTGSNEQIFNNAGRPMPVTLNNSQTTSAPLDIANIIRLFMS